MARPSSTERGRRMLALLPYLKRGEPIDLPGLARTLGVREEQLLDDLGLLSLCGLPPYSPDTLVAVLADEDAVEVFADPPALERPVRLSAPEARALAAALEACGIGPDEALTRRLLDAASCADGPEALAAMVRTSVATAGASIQGTIAAAVAMHEKLALAYFSPERGHTTTRVVRPLALAEDRGVWYLSTYCETACGERTFRLDRVLSADRTGETFTPPAAVVPPRVAAAYSGDLPRAVVTFAPGCEPSERDWPGAAFEAQPDGGVRAEVPYVSEGWLARRVVASLGDAEVVSPPEVRAAVKALAETTWP